MSQALVQLDPALAEGKEIVESALAAPDKRPEIKAFFDRATFTVSYIVIDPATREAAIVDSVLDYDPDAGRTSTRAADELIDYVTAHDLKVTWLLETHVHADHLSAAPYLQEKLGGKLAIGEHVLIVQDVFGKLFNAGSAFHRDGSQFDHLFSDGERFKIGTLDAVALHVPGHTPADMAYVIGDAVLAGDTLFMPDYGTARADFPGGDATTLFRSIRRLLALPREARLLTCHDYLAPGRDNYEWESTIGAQADGNIHVKHSISEAEFVNMRTERDATLAVPKLILPSVQVNMRGGHMPEPEDNGTSYIKIPINRI